jgi:hypothetical protein
VTYHLHELILEAAEVCEQSDHTHSAVAEAIGMKRDLHRRWRNRDLRAEGEYKTHKKDEARERSLAEWLEGREQPDASDVTETPVSDDDPNASDLTERERYIARRLRKGATTEGLADDLGTRETVIKRHLKDLRAMGWSVYRDDTAGHYAIEGDHALRSSEHKGTRTRKANRWWELRHSELVREYKALDEPTSELPRTESREDWVLHLTDLHAGDRVRSDDGRIVYTTADIPRVIDYATEQALGLVEHHNATYDCAHLLWGGDFLTNEGIYSGQFEDLDAWLDEQHDILVSPLIRQLKAFTERFHAVQVVCQVGNHGQHRASGTSRQANADLVLYKHIRNTVAQLQEHAGLLGNVNFLIGQAKAYRNFEMRGGEVSGHLRHGQNRRVQAETSARKKEWLSTLREHEFDVAYLGHHHVSGRVPWDGPPIVASSSPKPSGEFVEKLGESVSGGEQGIATAHGVSDDGITCVYPIDTRNY